MANTLLSLDVERKELAEARFTVTRHARDITAPAQKNDVFQWPATGSYTLQPINLTTDFSATNHWEAIKFRLSDCVYQPGWWTEVPDNVKSGIGPCDYFMNCVVKKENWNPSGRNDLIDLLVDIAGEAITFQINLENQRSVSAMRSSATLPANQGYLLRFRFDGRETFKRSGLLDFQFGEFALRVNSYGEAQLWQSTDFVTYGYVYSFRWANTDQIHGRSHSILIYPHARNKIEFITSTGGWELLHFGHGKIVTRAKGTPGHGLYEIPGELVYQADGVTPRITQAAPWTIAVSREFRPKFQVSRLSFANGTAPEAFFWDTPIDITGRTGVVLAPTVQLWPSVEFDPNGGRVQWGLRNADNGADFVSDGNSSKVQMAIGMIGLGDIAGAGIGSSVSPEVYNYTIDKPPLFVTTPRQTYNATTSDQVIDHGECPESERLSVTTYDAGAYLRYSERGDIPIELGDADSGLLYFEGTAFNVEAGESPHHTPNGLHIDAYGMVDNMLRMDWADTAPNFEIDPYDAEHRPYEVAEVIRVCFESCGESRENVVIEDEATYLRGFRLWHGPTGDGGTGGGHSAGTLEQLRWAPQPGLPVLEFTDHFIRKVLGWHWVRDKSDRKWHIYKRPDPQLAADAKKLKLKVEFYSDQHPQTDTSLPGYKHSNLKKHTRRPACTTIIGQAFMQVSDVPTKQALADLLAREQSGQGNPYDAAIATSLRLVSFPLTNYGGYPNPLNLHPDVSHPDFLGKQRIKMLPLPQINSRESALWICRREFEDNCFGYVYREFEADWGDAYTYNLRKWDVCLVNGLKHYIHRIEPKWGAGKLRRANYTVSKYRNDVRPPR